MVCALTTNEERSKCRTPLNAQLYMLKGVGGLPFTTSSQMNMFKFHQHTCGYHLNNKTKIFYD
jgi:hypothetical protein